MGSLQDVQPALAELLKNAVSEAGVAGTVVGVWHRGERLRLAEGTANLNSGQAMRTDTLWLLGSITKVLTAELLLRYIQAGAFGLDDKLCQHLPEFKLKDQDRAAQITLRQLINHSNGIDSDTWAPETANALDASAHYVRGLQQMGVLFEPGSNVHYSNPGFVLAARLLEVHSGENFNTLLEREIFARHGMKDACTSAQQAILRGTAIGAFVDTSGDSTDKGLRATPHFMSVSTGAGAGTTAIVSLDDMLSYAEHHLRPGDCVPAAMARAMQTPQLPERATKNTCADSQPGLGWWVDQLGDYRCLSHGGGSPGGLSQLSLLPELELAVVSFATGPEGPALHDDVLCTVIEQISGKAVAAYSNNEPAAALSDFVGCYGGFQAKHTISLDTEAQDGNDKAETRLKMVSEVPPFDEENRDFLLRYYGMLPPPVTRYFKPLGGDVIVEVEQDPAKLKGIYGPLATRALERNAQGEVIGIRCGSRYAKKQSG